MKIKYNLVQGNHDTLQQIALSENIFRKSLTISERISQYSIRVKNKEDIKQIAKSENLAPQTIEYYLKLENVPQKALELIDSKDLKIMDAVKAVDIMQSENLDFNDALEKAYSIKKSKKTNSSSNTKKKMRPRKEIEERLNNCKNKTEKNLLQWLLYIEDEEDK
jgi:hypothetical protein